MIQNTTVSIAMCTYNGSSFLEEQLNSIVTQTYPIKELLIFDDASTDGTVEILNNFSSRYPFIKVTVNKTNVGFTRNFEQAVKAATGDVIAIADQDDIWINTKVEKMLDAWRSECPLIYCATIMFSGRPPEHPKRHPLFRPFEGTDARKIFLRNTVSGHALMFRKSFLPYVLPFKEGVMYDWWMAVVAAYNGGVQFYPEILVLQREHGQNVSLDSSYNYTEKQRREVYKQSVINHCKAFENAPNIPPAHKKFAYDMFSLMEQSLSKQFYLPLFLFIVKNRKMLFNYKKRKVAFFSQVKHSFRRTIN